MGHTDAVGVVEVAGIGGDAGDGLAGDGANAPLGVIEIAVEPVIQDVSRAGGVVGKWPVQIPMATSGLN